MTGARWERLQELFHRALALDPGQRALLLDQECHRDPGLRVELERLLAAADRGAGFIDQPALAEAETERDQVPIDTIGPYRLVRSLGRGGMGVVYLAERADGAFRQRVAIKLIKRGMDTDQLLARFRAERQILASLDHPNIARLLDGGTTDDGLPYFTMEYIEGRPIDEFAGERGLGVDQRLALFLQVCDAVAYAHTKGVVHRDLKPLNTLVTPAGVPKLLDFGIAKVLEEDPDQPTATVTGLRLLTPDYASPEQVEGRRATAASDVYSLGVVLYELLTGCSPYSLAGRTPQDVADAVRTTEPVRPSTIVGDPTKGTGHRRRSAAPTESAGDPMAAKQLRRRLLGDLDTIVLTALRKEPARRYPSVAHLAEDIRRHLEGRPIAARADHLGYRARKFARRHRAVLLTAAATVIATTALAAAAWRLARPDRNDPTLLSARSLEARDRILVADFIDRTGDGVLASAVTEALRTDLSQSAVIRVMTPRQVRGSLTMMQQSPDVALNDSLAREVAMREGVKAIVTGSLSQVSGSYTISVQLVSAASGEVLAAVRENAADSTRLIAAIDRASKSLRRRIGETLRDLESMPSLIQATTASLPALRLYTEAQRLVRQGKRTEAVARFTEAVALDSGFASAHLGLSMAYGSIADEGRSFDAGRRALEHRERLPFLERQTLIASRAYAGLDYPAAIEAYTDIIGRYPENLAALNNLALAYRDSRQFPVAESLFHRAIAADTTIANFLFGLHTAQILQGKFADGAATLETLARRFPNHPVYLTEVMQDAAAQQDWERAERVAWTHIEKLDSDTLQLVDPYEALAQMAMLQGRLRESERLWRDHAAVSRAAGVMSRHLFGTLQLAYLLLRVRDDTARAVALVDSVLRITPLDGLLRGDRRYDEVARFYLAARRPGRVAPLLDAAEVNDSALHRTNLNERRWTRGALALSEGKVPEAISALEQASERHVCTICVLPELGRALERAGRDREAAAIYRRYLTTPWLWRYEPDAVELAWILRRLALLSDRLGDSTGARAARQQFLQLWRRADPELRPVLDSVRSRLRR